MLPGYSCYSAHIIILVLILVLCVCVCSTSAPRESAEAHECCHLRVDALRHCRLYLELLLLLLCQGNRNARVSMCTPQLPDACHAPSFRACARAAPAAAAPPPQPPMPRAPRSWAQLAALARVYACAPRTLPAPPQPLNAQRACSCPVLFALRFAYKRTSVPGHTGVDAAVSSRHARRLPLMWSK